MIYVISGPPCSGKSTYIRENAKQGDVIVDMDRIAMSLVDGFDLHDYPDYIRPIAREARKGAVRAAISAHQQYSGFAVFIIHSQPSADDRRWYRVIGAKMVELSPGLQVCLDRLKLRPVKNQQLADKVIRDWYAVR